MKKVLVVWKNRKKSAKGRILRENSRGMEVLWEKNGGHLNEQPEWVPFAARELEVLPS